MGAQNCPFAYSCATEQGKRKYRIVVPVTCRNINLSILLYLGFLLPFRCARVTRGFLSYVPCLLSLSLVPSCPLSPVPWCPLSPLVPCLLSPLVPSPLSPLVPCPLASLVPCPLPPVLAVLCKLLPIVITCALMSPVPCPLSLVIVHSHMISLVTWCPCSCRCLLLVALITCSVSSHVVVCPLIASRLPLSSYSLLLKLLL